MKKHLLHNLVEKNYGYVTTAEAEALGMSRRYFLTLVKEGDFLRVDRGLYLSPDGWRDTMYELQHRFPRAIFSHASALNLHNLTESDGGQLSVTVPSGYNAKGLYELGCLVHYVDKKYYELGKTSMRSWVGHEVVCYDKERSICDLFRAGNSVGQQDREYALKTYFKQPDRQLSYLASVAETLGVRDKLMAYVEVLT